MMFVGFVMLMAALIIELLRWTTRPEARRLRQLRKIGGRR